MKERCLKRKLDGANLVAPCDGMVVYADSLSDSAPGIHVGSRLAEGQLVFAMIDPANGPLRMTCTVADSDLEGVVPGTKAVLQQAGVAEHAGQGTVQPLAPVRRSGLSGLASPDYTAIVEVDGRPAALRPGMRVQAAIVAAQLNDVLTVPKAALIRSGSSTGSVCVRVRVSKGSIEDGPVIPGLTSQDRVEIKAGLKDGDVVAVDSRASRR